MLKYAPKGGSKWWNNAKNLALGPSENIKTGLLIFFRLGENEPTLCFPAVQSNSLGSADSLVLF